MSSNQIEQRSRQNSRQAAVKNQFEGKKTNLPHIELIDIDETGLLKEVAVVKRESDGTLYYIDIDVLHPVDKARIKKIVTSVHADKYPLWELMSQATLNNGLNALDYFHYNMVKVKRPKGVRAANQVNSIANVNVNMSENMIGSEFTNPAEAELDMNTQLFNNGVRSAL